MECGLAEFVASQGEGQLFFFCDHNNGMELFQQFGHYQQDINNQHPGTHFNELK